MKDFIRLFPILLLFYWPYLLVLVVGCSFAFYKLGVDKKLISNNFKGFFASFFCSLICVSVISFFVFYILVITGNLDIQV